MDEQNPYTVYAVKSVPPSEEDSTYWLPKIYEEMKNGNARIGWSYCDDADLPVIQHKIQEQGWNQLSEDEASIWSHTAFLLEVKPGDYFVYINMPDYGNCTIVKIKDFYRFDEIWDVEQRDDFRHIMPCEFVDTFDRNADIVAPYLSRRLKLMGSWYRIYAQTEFEELLENLRSGSEGIAPKKRLRQEIHSRLLEIAEQTYRHFPAHNLETLLADVFKNLPAVKEVRWGPDINGADLEIEFESGLSVSGLQKTEICAVQVKAYKDAMDCDRAIEDIRKAFQTTPQYTCGLIVSTALELTEAFEQKVEVLKSEFGKDVGVLVGKDLAYMLIQSGFTEDEHD